MIRVNGYVCELQLNIDDMLVIKEGAGHKQYELERKVNDELIHAAMKGDVEKLQLSLDSSANPNASRDMYNLESLHYAQDHVYESNLHSEFGFLAVLATHQKLSFVKILGLWPWLQGLSLIHI